jgi:hypothetical protein
VVVNRPDPTFIDVMCLPARHVEIGALAARHLERDDVRVDLIQELERRLSRPAANIRCCDGVAQHVAPHFGLRAQAFHRIVEDLQHELRRNHPDPCLPRAAGR